MYTAARLRLTVLRLLQIFSLGLCVSAGDAWAAGGITVTLSDALGTDVNSDGKLNPGDSIIYTAKVTNGSGEAASGLLFTADPDALMSLVVGSVRIATGAVTVGNAPSDTAVRVKLDDLLAGQTVTLTFEVQLSASAARPSSGVVSTAAAVTAGETRVVSDDPKTTAALDPTATEVVIPAPPTADPSVALQFSGGGLSGCTVSSSRTAQTPLFLLSAAAALLALLRRRAST